MPLCLRSFGEENKGSTSSNKNNKERMTSGSSVSNSMMSDSRSKRTSGSKDSCGKNTEPKNQESEKTKSKDTTFIVVQKNMRSIHLSERIQEMVCELEGYRWDAILMSETWRPEKSEIWETHQKHIFMGAGKYDNKHGVGIMLNTKWQQQIIDTEHINERAITATIVVNHQRIKLMSVYFLALEDRCGPPRRKNVQNKSRNTRQTTETAYRSLEETSMLSWDQDKEQNVQVLANTHSTEEAREVTG